MWLMLMWLWVRWYSLLLECWWARGREKADVAWVRLRYSLSTTGTSLSMQGIHISIQSSQVMPHQHLSNIICHIILHNNITLKWFISLIWYPFKILFSPLCYTQWDEQNWWSLVLRVLHLLDLVERNKGASMSRPTWPKDTGREAPNWGGLEDRYSIKSYK
jgi:hypothetical protein